MLQVELLIIGGGPAAMAAAKGARDNGINDILILERNDRLGGILPQCIHNGFGLHYFKEELTGPEYANRFEEYLREQKINVKLNTMVIDLSSDLVVTAINHTDGAMQIQAKAIVLAMGCRERTRGALNIPGCRPAGIFTAGTAQRFVNMEGFMPGKEIVILGSGDIGLIMARRMTLEGAKVKMVCELMPYSSGLQRNIVQCLEDYDIPLKLSHTVVEIHGKERVTGVTVARVDENLKPVEGSFEYVECDTLLLSVGLLPENELSRQAGIEIDNVTGGPIVNESMETTVPGIFACGNVVHVHDLVDYVTLESLRAGRGAAEYIQNSDHAQPNLFTEGGKGVRYVIPQKIRTGSLKDKLQLFFRVDKTYHNSRIEVVNNGKVIKSVKKSHLAPGEMETLELKAEELSSGKLEVVRRSEDK